MNFVKTEENIYEDGIFSEREVDTFNRPDKTQQRTFVALSASQSTPRRSRGQEIYEVS
ncbi:unnamed protein product [Allacma fusca]|uniref:Uncharacterized protein n=1 Tax=Allacma fusca TaxID=39272 RepID=A0A8J2PMD7_9HEXA|nr:unnamed protein product [Allacma fusca]